MTKYYAGIGSRKTPEAICESMTEIASFLEKHGYILRSGGAEGADLAFENGINYEGNKAIYLPWKGFNDSPSHLYLENFRESTHAAAYQIAKKYYRNLDHASRATRNFMTRNVFQVLGSNPGFSVRSEFVICWTADGKASGGTGQALRIAKDLDIPIFNLYNIEDLNRLKSFLDKIKRDSISI